MFKSKWAFLALVCVMWNGSSAFAQENPADSIWKEVLEIEALKNRLKKENTLKSIEISDLNATPSSQTGEEFHCYESINRQRGITNGAEFSPSYTVNALFTITVGSGRTDECRIDGLEMETNSNEGYKIDCKGPGITAWLVPILTNQNSRCALLLYMAARPSEGAEPVVATRSVVSVYVKATER